MTRYLALIWDPRRVDAVRAFQALRGALASRPLEWIVAFEAAGMMVVVQAGVRSVGSSIHRLAPNRGVVLGRLFTGVGSEAGEAPAHIEEREAQSIVESGGRKLIEQYWGAYVAFLYDDTSDRRHVVREPAANTPCYHLRHREIDVYCSHIEDCVRCLPIAFAVDRRYLTRWLIASRLINGECGLEGVEEVRGGERFTLADGRMTRAFLWNPVEIARAPRYENVDEAARALRTTVQAAIGAWASCYQNIAHKLSGGLDSSIVAGCLARAPSRPQLSLLHFSIDAELAQERMYLPGIDKQTADKLRALTGPGDERRYARLVAAKWGLPLFEISRQLSMDLTRLWAAPISVAPSGYFTAIESDDAEIEFVEKHGAQAFFSGQAGDSVFFATTQALASIDYVRLHGLRFGLLRHLLATATLSRESFWSVLAKTLKHGLLRRPWRSPFSVLQPPTLLTREIVASLNDDAFMDHWAETSADLPPGKRHHVSAISSSTYHDCVFHSQRYAEHVDPLNSQPIWELMMQIPSYVVLTGGVNRGLARSAFAELLPPQIRRRQIKGTGAQFYQQLVRRNRGYLRQTLLDGLLVKEGYLDRARLESYLAAEEPFVTVGALEVLSYLAAEVWMQQWASVRGSSAAAGEAVEPKSSAHSAR